MALSDEIRAQVKAALLAGLGISETARKLKLPKTTVARIKTELVPETLERAGAERKERIDDLLLGSIRKHIVAADRIADRASQPQYIDRQGAEALASLHRQISDHAVRLLEAASAAGVEDPGGADPGQ